MGILWTIKRTMLHERIIVISIQVVLYISFYIEKYVAHSILRLANFNKHFSTENNCKLYVDEPNKWISLF